MQITNIQTNPYNKYPCASNNKPIQFGQYVSKLGHKIDDVLRTKEPSPEALGSLYEGLLEFVKSPKFDAKLKGKGFYSKIFNIDDKYVLKVGKYGRKFPEPNIEIREPLFPELKTYYGDALIISGDLKILRNVSSTNKHIVAGVPSEIIEKSSVPRGAKTSLPQRYSVMFADYNHGNDVLKYYNEVYLPTFAKLPQSSFDKLANDLALLNKKGFNEVGFGIDTNNPNNIVLVGKSSLRIVDDIDVHRTRKPNTIGGLLNMLLVKADYDTTLPLPTNSSSKALRFELFRKIVLAGEKYDLPLLCPDKFEKTVWDHATYGFKHYGEIILENIQNIRDNVPNKKQRFIEIEKYINSLGEGLERNSNQ